ncbi:hypothetical protein WAF17_17325 [Bernardetia sp. ABR2-2B]|uniref:hypothetical protein n=1 Tax=Bernardetia sp. ABR2-2B TaxID=3127472 RepID=UPI0030CC6E8F
MNKLSLLFAVFFLSFTFQSDKMIVTVLSVSLDAPIYDYFCIDSVYNDDTKRVNLKVLYSEKKQNIILIKNGKYEIEFIKWNPSKMIVGNDTLNHRGSCALDFGKRIVDNCREMKHEERLRKGKECIVKEIEYYEVLKVIE